MPAYRENEKRRHIDQSRSIFGSSAGRMGGSYNRRKRPFCLPDNLSAHNLHESIRQDAIEYFLKRRIPWHNGHPYKDHRTGEQIKSENTARAFIY